MTQGTFGTIDTTTTDGDDLAALLEMFESVIQSMNGGSSAPSYAVNGTLWKDTTSDPHLIKQFDGADWITLMAVGISANTVQPYQGQTPLKFTPNASDTGIADVYAMAPVPAIDAYRSGQIFFLKPANNNTGACTLNVSAKGALSIKMPDGSNPPANAIATSGCYMLFNTGSTLILMNPSIYSFLQAKGTTIPSASTVDLGAADSDFIDISGTTAITSFGSTLGKNHVWIRFTGACTLTYHATQLILPSATNIVTVAGDTCEAIRISAGNWLVFNYTRATGKSLVTDQPGMMLCTSDYGTEGGAGGLPAAQHTWTRRAITTVAKNTIAGALLATCIITLPAGAYYIDAEVVVSNESTTVAAIGLLRLRDTTNGVDLAIGAETFAPPTAWPTGGAGDVTSAMHMRLRGTFTLSAPANVELQYWLNDAGSVRLGRSITRQNYAGTNGYTQDPKYVVVEIRKES